MELIYVLRKRVTELTTLEQKLTEESHPLASGSLELNAKIGEVRDARARRLELEEIIKNLPKTDNEKKVRVRTSIVQRSPEEDEAFHNSLVMKGISEVRKGWDGDALDYFKKLQQYMINVTATVIKQSEIEQWETLERMWVKNNDKLTEVGEFIDRSIHVLYEEARILTENCQILEKELNL